MQTETWLDKTSFFSQFKSHTYAAAGAVGNLAEGATVPIGSDTTNPSGIWLGTVYGSSIQADRVVKNTVAEGKAKYNLKFVDCSNGYSVEFPLVIPNSQDVFTPDCQVLVLSLKDSQGNPWEAVYWIYAVDNTVGEVLFEAPEATESANQNTFFPDALQLASGGGLVLYHATANGDPGPVPAEARPSVRPSGVKHFELALRPVAGLRLGAPISASH